MQHAAALVLVGGVAAFWAWARPAEMVWCAPLLVLAAGIAPQLIRARGPSPAAAERLDVEDLTRDLLDSVNELVIRVDGDGRLTSVNAAAQRLIWRGVEPRQSCSIFDFVHKDDVDLFRKALSPELAGERNELPPFRIVRDDGKLLFMEGACRHWRIGKPAGGVLLVLRDVGERRRDDERFRSLFERAPSPLIMVNANGEIVLANAQAEELFGYSRGELLALRVEDLVPIRFLAGHPELRREYLRSPRPKAMGQGRDLYARRKDGVEVPVEIGLTPLEMQDGLHVLAGVIDISARKKAEEQSGRSLREKEALLREVHHRVKNNLQIISSLLRMQERTSGITEVSSALRASEGRIQSMSLLHESLYGAEYTGRIDLASYVKTLTSGIFSSYGVDPSRIRLALDLEMVDLELDQAVPCGLVINELVSNALKHAFPAGASGSVHLTIRRHGDGVLRIVVRDNGRGLPEGFSLERSGSLGMRLVRVLVEQLRGKLSFAHELGSCFSIDFPFTRSSALDPSPQAEELLCRKTES